MKNFLTIGLLAFLFAFSGNTLAGKRKVVVVKSKATKTRVVKVKPVARQITVKPSFIRPGYMWTEGYWKWNNRSKTYIWINGKVIRKKKNKAWINGHWTRRSGGYYYVRGHWA